MMVLNKRKRICEASGSEAPSDDGYSSSDVEMDISSALTGKKPRLVSTSQAYLSDDDEDLQNVIRESVSKRDKKKGTELLKSTKGKKKLVKGEVGGGSFQSMGTSVCMA